MENYELSIEFNPEIIQRIYSVIQGDPSYMPKPYRNGMMRIDQALEQINDTRALRVGEGIIVEAGELFFKQFPHQKAIVVADSTTYEVAGRQVEESLRKANIEVEPSYVFQAEGLRAEFDKVNKLMNRLKRCEATPIAVGAGSINDLVKLSSHLCGRHYMCVPTAASMDGYTAYGASILTNDISQNFPCPAPQAVLADTSIMMSAPQLMTNSGFANLFSKMTAGADWILADWMGMEPINEKAWRISQRGFHEALLLTDKETVVNQHDTMSRLIEGLMLSGFATQVVRSDYPASGAEYILSNIWEMQRHKRELEPLPYGNLLSIAVLAINQLYDKLLNTPIESLNIAASVKAWPDAETYEQEALKAVVKVGLPELGIQEAKAKYITPEELSIQLHQFKEYWPAVKDRLAQQLIPYRELKQKMKRIGLPVELDEIGISRRELRETIAYAQYLGRRFTIIDLAARTGYLRKWTTEIF